MFAWDKAPKAELGFNLNPFGNNFGPICAPRRLNMVNLQVQRKLSKHMLSFMFATLFGFRRRLAHWAQLGAKVLPRKPEAAVGPKPSPARANIDHPMQTTQCNMIRNAETVH